jgi:hypothetical protein
MAQDSARAPSGAFSTAALTNSAQAVGTSSARLFMEWGHLVGGAAAETVVFRASSGGATYFTLKLPAGSVIPLREFAFASGLEVLTGDAAGDVGVFIAYRVRS